MFNSLLTRTFHGCWLLKFVDKFYLYEDNMMEGSLSHVSDSNHELLSTNTRLHIHSDNLRQQNTDINGLD